MIFPFQIFFPFTTVLKENHGCKVPAQKIQNDKYYFNLIAPNGEIVLTSQMYTSKRGAKKGVAAVQNNASDPDQFEDHINKSGKHYFVLKAKNHQVIASGQGYANKTGMKNGVKSVAKHGPVAKIEEPK